MRDNGFMQFSLCLSKQTLSTPAAKEKTQGMPLKPLEGGLVLFYLQVNGII